MQHTSTDLQQNGKIISVTYREAGLSRRDLKSISDFIKEVPIISQKLFSKVLRGKSSPREAIKAKCIECNGHEKVRRRIRECEIKTCALWHFRPYQKGQCKHG